jgi:4-amino-4-deoxy-L-arabinose transferase-like glycosyltransferase
VAVAVANAWLWALVTPAFQVPDELAHVAYVQYLGETGDLPRPQEQGSSRSLSVFSDEEARTGSAIRFSIDGKPSWSQSDDHGLRRALERDLSRRSSGGATTATNNPPLYYALEALPYRVAHSASFLDRLFILRLFSGLLAGLTVGFVFLFLRELLPRTPWTWTVGALAVAFQPMFGFMSGGVNNDNLLYACCAGVIMFMARAFRSGLTPRRGAALGLLLSAGLLTKGTMFAFVPAVALAGVLCVLRSAGPGRRRTLVACGVLFACAAVPFAVWLMANQLVFDRPANTTTAGGASAAGAAHLNVKGGLGYLWQSFFPRLPFMEDQFQQYPQYLLWESYFQGFVGRFGWFQYGFPLWVYEVALGIFAAVLAFAAVALARARSVVRERLGELACYVVVCLAVVAVVGLAGYRQLVFSNLPFEQGRYLLPLLPLYGALIALAARGAGRRWGPVAGAVLVVLAMAHSLFAELLTVARYYS